MANLLAPVLDSEEVSSDLPDEEVFVVEAKEWELYFDGSSISTARAECCRRGGSKSSSS